MTTTPETPEETKALNSCIKQLMQMDVTGLDLFPGSLRALLRLLYLAGQKDALGESIRATIHE